MKIYNSIDDLVGKTPLFKLNNIIKSENIKANIFAKLEMFNPAGSIKDRVALEMINKAMENGDISKGATIIEPTSGNTGIGLASIGIAKGYKVILTMPDSMSAERIKLLKAYGATIVLTDGEKGMAGAIEKANELHENTPNSFIPSQFSNSANPMAHFNNTAREIVDDLDGRIDVIVACFGTGGTISGIGKYFKENGYLTQIIAVEPNDSPLVSKGYSGKHKIQGIGANFVPDNFYSRFIDKVLTATNDDAYNMARRVAREEGLLIGISSGAALSVALKLANEPKYYGKNIVVIFPDSGDRYLSTDLFND